MQEKDNSIKIHWDRLITAIEKKNYLSIGIAIVVIIVLTAGEAIRVLCRKNQGEYEISYIRLGLSLLGFLSYGAALVIWNDTFVHWIFYKTFAATRATMIITAVAYVLFGIIVFVAGMVAKNYAEKRTFLIDDPEYPGDSLLFADKNFAKVRNFYEPFTFLVTGILLGLMHPLIGFPLVLCALMYWVCLIVELSFKIEQKRRRAITKRYDILKGPLIKLVRPHAAKKRLFEIRISWLKS